MHDEDIEPGHILETVGRDDQRERKLDDASNDQRQPSERVQYGANTEKSFLAGGQSDEDDGLPHENPERGDEMVRAAVDIAHDELETRRVRDNRDQ